MSFCKIVQDSVFPFVGYTFDDDGKLYCKTCGAESKREHSSVCPQVRHWPTRKQIRAANNRILEMSMFFAKRIQDGSAGGLISET